MDNRIYEKYELIDLAKYGSSARKEIKPKLYVADSGKYPRGDMLDANLQTQLFTEFIGSKFLFYDTEAQFDRDVAYLPAGAIAFIKDKQLIWADGTYYSGGGGESGGSIDISNTPIYYYVFEDRDTIVPSDLVTYTRRNTLTASKQLSIELTNNFLFLAVPNNITLIRAVTSRDEELSLTDNFSTDTQTLSEHTVWIYKPAVAPQSLKLIFTFTLPTS